MPTANKGPNDPPMMPLAMALVGQNVRFMTATGGAGLARRLAEMGLTPGEQMEVINRGPGPFIISVRGTKLVLGRGMVHKIFVRPG